MTQGSPLTNLGDHAKRLGQNVRSELVGIVLAIVGILLLISVLRYQPDGSGPAPLLVLFAGWTALPLSLAVLAVGIVLIFRERAGYWSAEALVGVELLLLGLMAGAYVGNHRTVNWSVQLSDADGGLVGWALGNLLMAGLGRWLATLVTAIAVMAGVIFLFRFTPLIYLGSLLTRYGRGLGAGLFTRPASNRYPPPAHTANFVPPLPDPPAQTRQPAAAAPAAGSERAPISPATAAPPPSAAKNAKTPKHTPASTGADAPGALATANLGSASLLPPLDLLGSDSGSYGNRNVGILQQVIVRTLEDFSVPVRVVHVETGPTVTQFGVEPLYVERAGQKRKIRVNRIVGLANDLALALAAPAVRIEAPVPGRPYVGIEVPNPDKSLVSLRGILDSPEMRKGGDLALGLGRNTAGAPMVMDLTKAPHMLIAGATGSGKSVCINTIITSLLMKHGPDTLRFVMVDPKMVELPGYNGIPHLYGKVITDSQQVMGALTWLLLQMDDRYQLFRDLGVRNVDTYNAIMRKQKNGQVLPYIVLVVDELADLMMTAPEDIERLVCRLAQMARATGIHLILATQRPSTDVVTGLIKANFPTRISFAVTSQIDSRVVLDTPGAEALLGRGDMLLMRPDLGKLTRIQGCYVTDDEIARIVAFWKTNGPSQPAVTPPWNGIMDQLDNEDELIQRAIDVVGGMKTCSTSMLQRKLGLGYPKAARLMEELEERGVVGPDLGAGRGRTVLTDDRADESDDL